MGSSWSRRDRIIRLAKLRGDRAALAIMDGNEVWRLQGRLRASVFDIDDAIQARIRPVIETTESELRALWGDR